MRGQDDDGDDKSVSRSRVPGNSKASNLDLNELVREDGTFFGIPMGPGVASTFEFINTQLKLPLSDYVRKHSEQIAYKIAKESFNKPHNEAQVIASGIAKFATYGTLLSNHVADLFMNVANTADSMRQVREAVLPVYNANGGNAQIDALFSDRNNSVIHAARAKINGIAKARFLKTLVGVAGESPLIWSAYMKEKANFADKDKQKSISEHLDDPEKLAELIQVDIEKSGMGKLEAKEKAWSGFWKKKVGAYTENYKKFESSNKYKFESELRTAIATEAKGASLSDYQKEKLGKEWGISNTLIKNYDKLSKTDKKNLDREMKEAVERKLKTEFAKEHGALDHHWPQAANDKRDTLEKRSRDEFNKFVDPALGLGKKAEEESKLGKEYNDSIKDQLAGVASNLLREGGQAFLGLKSLEQYRKDTAFDLIMHLRRAEEKNSGQLETVPARVIGNKTTLNEMGIAQYVHQVFEQNQVDNGLAAIGDRYFAHFKEASWSDKAIQELKDDELTAYEFAVKHIARRIRDGRMDALALIDLVGDSQRHIVRKSGNQFGPENLGTKDEKALKTGIEKLVDDETAKFHLHQKVTEEQLAEALSSFTFTPEELKAKFAPNAMPREEQAFLLVLLEERVHNVAELKKLTGRSESELDGLRREGQKSFEKLMDAAISEISDLAESQPEKLEALKITPEELSVLKRLSGKIEQGKSDVLEGSSRDDRQAAEAVVANVMMQEAASPDTKEKKGFWQRLVAASRGEKEPKQEKDSPREAGEEGEYSARDSHEEDRLEKRARKHEKHERRHHHEEEERPAKHAHERLKKSTPSSLMARGNGEDDDVPNHVAALRNGSESEHYLGA